MMTYFSAVWRTAPFPP
jgi:hypothetical protein